MEELANDNNGYVYILEVKDIDLPVCKIGMTRRTPYERCDEINNSSTGDFIWSVAHYIAVDDCKKLESLVHSKLAPLRQKGREFFNINADDANTALLSIFEKQTEIKKENVEEITPPTTKSKNKARKRQRAFRRIDSEYAELLQLFASLLNVKGRPFGQLNKPSFGMSDGNEGVQWNLSVSTDTDIVRLGVNLEGMKYRNWPISKFILSEIDKPKISEITAKMDYPDNIFIRFSRDAWQVTSRPTIIEKYLGGKEFTLAEMNTHQWLNTLKEALGCLNEKGNYLSRAKQTVTLENKPRNGEQVRVMEVSPHLTIWSPLGLNGNMQENLKNKIAELQPVYNWVKEVSEQ
ncbi:hypothetical protein [Methylomonas albis]|uniref:GIY-YIG nuclease family protein n=1 Tax=Methylomonas albis TaxID=1854563 RepID=A0ABR9CW94_9GAMM|nr:GIY-YIG nuclease family protein [Methylomonas albis]MBD9355129.1 GIY-YIG nuclease family protein [Methylomonas albis]CAD6878061.1 hypothetical protein [Methylomonas albis]